MEFRSINLDTTSLTLEAEQWFINQDPETFPECVRWSHGLGAYYVSSLVGDVALQSGDYIFDTLLGPVAVDQHLFESSYVPART